MNRYPVLAKEWIQDFGSLPFEERKKSFLELGHLVRVEVPKIAKRDHKFELDRQTREWNKEKDGCKEKKKKKKM